MKGIPAGWLTHVYFHANASSAGLLGVPIGKNEPLNQSTQLKMRNLSLLHLILSHHRWDRPAERRGYRRVWIPGDGITIGHWEYQRITVEDSIAEVGWRSDSSRFFWSKNKETWIPLDPSGGYASFITSFGNLSDTEKRKTKCTQEFYDILHQALPTLAITRTLKRK